MQTELIVKDHYLLIFQQKKLRKLRAKYNDTLQVNASKELGTTFNCVRFKTNGGLSLDATTKL